MARVPMWRRYARLFGADPRADVEDELQFHIQAKTDDLIAQGWRPEEARREAERQFGDIQAVYKTGRQLGREREQARQRREYWRECIQDIRYALRTLRKDRSFAVVAILILGLGIAANTAVFSIVNTVLLRPLPFPDAHQLAWMASGKKLSPGLAQAAGLSAVTYKVSAYEEFQRHNHSFESVASYNPFFGNSEYTLTGRGEPQPIDGVMVSENFFQTLRVQPLHGRLFLHEECQKGGPPAVLLSDAFWQRQFAGDPAIIGQAITLSNRPATVVGILPPTFDFGSVFSPGLKIDVYVPAVMDVLRNWGNTLALVGRLKPGVSVAQAQAEADVLFPRLKSAHKDWWADYSSTIIGLKEFVSGKLRRSLLVLWSAVGLILLIVCVNLSNLLIARAVTRSKEFAVRSALGASRARLFRQLLTESLILAGRGATLGLVLAWALTIYLARQGSIVLPLLTHVRVDAAALTWTLAITILITLLFGLVPALKLAAGNLQDSLKDGGHGVSAGRRHQRLRSGMVISEVALSCVLLAGAGLLLRSFLNVLAVDLGFEPSRAATIKIDYDDGNNPARRGPVLEEILRRMHSIPGVEAAGIADMLPLGRNRSWGFSAKGKSYAKGEILTATVRIVTPGYLEAMGMRLRSGRDFSWRDSTKSEHVVIINQAAARRFWLGEDPLGRASFVDGMETRVVGVISDVREHSLETSAGPEIYLPVTQAGPEGAELVIRTKLPPEALAATVMKTLRSLNPNQPAATLQPLRQIVDRAVSPRRFFVLLVSSFAALGLVLASLGIYGVISYTVARQTQEIGIRMALGATARLVEFGILSKALRLALAGMALGTIASFAAAHWIASLLFGAEPADPATFAAIVALLTAAALLAGYLPARRAARIEPMIALRNA